MKLQDANQRYYDQRSDMPFYTDGEPTGPESAAMGKFNPGEVVIDVSCGGGRLSFWLARRGLRASGVDFAPSMIEKANEKAALDGLDAHFVTGDAMDLPFTDGVFDHAIYMGSLMYVATLAGRRTVLREIKRVLKPGGSLLITVSGRQHPGHYGLRWLAMGASAMVSLPRMLFLRGLGRWNDQSVGRLGDAFWPFQGRAAFIHHFTMPELRGLLTAAGFRVLQSDSTNPGTDHIVEAVSQE
jgi:SAM-dependent methyltransferase